MLLIAQLVLGLVVPQWFEKNMLPRSQAIRAMSTIKEVPTTVIVDANNCRGAVAFRFSKLNFVDLVTSWAKAHDLEERVIICWDHGSVRQLVEYDNVVHVFAGPRESADDLIAETVLPQLYESTNERLYVVTTDRGLIARCKHAAAVSRACKGQLRLLGTRKFASLLLHAADSPISRQLQTDDNRSLSLNPGQSIAFRYQRGESAMRKFTATQHKRRRHEHKRRRVVSSAGFAAPFAEKSWHRIVMAEKLRRLLVENVVEVEGGRSAAAAALGDSFESPIANADAARLLQDVRLDAKQRALILRFGGALSDGLLKSPSKKDQEEIRAAEALPRTVASFHPSRRGRRAQREASRARLQGGALVAVDEQGRRSQAEVAVLERAAQLGGLDKWLLGDESLWQEDEA